MRTLALLLIFLIILAGALIAYTPLGFVVSQSGVSAAGVGWAKVDGTLAKGRISGLYMGTQPIGDVSLTLRPMSLLTLQPSYDVQWGGAGGRGTGVLTLSRSALTGTDIRMQQEIGALEGLSGPVRAMGGSLRIADGTFRLTQTGCESASGTLSTDTLSTLAAQYGRQFGQIAGPVSCDAGAFIIAMAGDSEAGDRVEIEARAAFTGQSDFTTRIDTQDTQIIIALTQVGFQRENGQFVYRQSRGAGL
ncbi:MAG: type II secretion system protein N [Cyanobacteria bacterium P01_E01_bin.43]